MGSLRRSAEPVTIGPGNPRSAKCTSWERRSSGTIELSASAGSERWAACDDDGALFLKLSHAAVTGHEVCELFNALERERGPPQGAHGYAHEHHGVVIGGDAV